MAGVCVAGLVSAGAAWAAPHRFSCALTHSHTVAADKQARVFYTSVRHSDGSVDRTYFGCLYNVGKRFGFPANSQDVGFEQAYPNPVRLAGRYFAYVQTDSSNSLMGVMVLNLHSGRLVSEAYDTNSDHDTVPGVVAIVLNGDGHVAWIEGGVDVGTEVDKVDGSGKQILDSSVESGKQSIDSHSLRLQGSTVTWKHGGVLRSDKLVAGSAPVESGSPFASLGVACPSVTRCTAVGHHGREVSFDPIAPGTPTPTVIDNAASSLNEVACPSATQCTAVDNSGHELTFDPAAPGTPTPTLIDSANLISGVACPSISQCTAVDTGGREVTFDPAAPGTPTPTTIAKDRNLGGVACPSLSQCTTISEDGSLTFNPTAPGTPTPTALSGGPWGSPACPSLSQCTAVDGIGQQVTFNPTAPGNAMSTFIVGGLVNGGGGPVACPSLSQCTAVDALGRQVTFNPTAPGTPSPAQIDNAHSFLSVACPSANQCTAVDGIGQQMTFNPITPDTRPSPTAFATDPAPQLTGYRMTNTTFAVDAAPTPTSGVAATTHPQGTTFEYSLSESATAKIVIAQHQPGRLNGKKCLAPTTKLANAKKCTKTVVNGTLTRTSKKGANNVAFSGRIATQALSPGHYRATLTAIDDVDQTSKPQTIPFTITAG
jgi:hypothetical protein